MDSSLSQAVKLIAVVAAMASSIALYAALFKMVVTVFMLFRFSDYYFLLFNKKRRRGGGV
jgi:energy-converting hydrogenase Eha subunit C